MKFIVLSHVSLSLRHLCCWALLSCFTIINLKDATVWLLLDSWMLNASNDLQLWYLLIPFLFFFFFVVVRFIFNITVWCLAQNGLKHLFLLSSSLKKLSGIHKPEIQTLEYLTMLIRKLFAGDHILMCLFFFFFFSVFETEFFFIALAVLELTL
jgi:hypothetical protein